MFHETASKKSHIQTESHLPRPYSHVRCASGSDSSGSWSGAGPANAAPASSIGNYYYFSNTLNGGQADSVVVYGKASDTVLVGDWDGDGVDTLAVRRGNAYHIKNSISGGAADKVIYYGRSTDNGARW
ncbi:hypothetical protein [Changpingibacter yushuensis]|uniref:hypothetical protein n=1 Tax=Changpingibacter yushuensis TaxID=2758440 RepID=UPI0015F42F41|nr:hypothetical protein [Changpingibacter yushuensis]